MPIKSAIEEATDIAFNQGGRYDSQSQKEFSDWLYRNRTKITTTTIALLTKYEIDLASAYKTEALYTNQLKIQIETIHVQSSDPNVCENLGTALKEFLHTSKLLEKKPNNVKLQETSVRLYNGMLRQIINGDAHVWFKQHNIKEQQAKIFDLIKHHSNLKGVFKQACDDFDKYQQACKNREVIIDESIERSIKFRFDWEKKITYRQSTRQTKINFS